MFGQHSILRKKGEKLFNSLSLSFVFFLTLQPSFALDANLLIARKEFISGNYDRVVTLLKGKTDLDSIILVGRSRFLLDETDFGPLGAFVNKEPNNEKALTALAFAEEEMRHYGIAERVIQSVFKISHQNAEAIACFALCKIRQGNETLGVKILEDALKINDRDPIVLELAEGGYDCVFDSVQAEKMCDRLIALQPRNPYFWTIKGHFMERAGKQGKAVECYSKAIEINPRYDFAYTYRARVYFDRHDYANVVKDATAGIKSGMTRGQTRDLLMLRAGANRFLNKHVEAIADLKEYLKSTDADHHPQNVKADDAYLHLSMEYIALGKYADAENTLAHMKKLNRRHSEILEQEAMIQAKQGHKDAAIKMYEKLLKEDGSFPAWVAAVKKLKGQ